MVPWRLAGLDIGFSQTARSSGVAIQREEALLLEHLDIASARALLLDHGRYDCLAIDGPWPPLDLELTAPRSVERLFCRGVFARRCKPGMSHIPGTGQAFRRATMSAATALAARADLIVEAFPNAFLAVGLPDRLLADRPVLRRGRKFDWLYDAWVESGLTQRLLAELGISHPTLVSRLSRTSNHDERAALICLLTALCVASGRFVKVGDPKTGWFFLPPEALWEDWARKGLDKEARRLPVIQVSRR